LLHAAKKRNPCEELAKLKKDRSELDQKIMKLEGNKKDSVKVTPVSVTEVQPTDFHAYIEVQSQIGGDEVVNATAKMPGTIKTVLAQLGQKVHAGQRLATLDASVVDQQMKAMDPQIELAKSLHEKQQKLWAQNIGTEVQLMSSKSSFESLVQSKEALKGSA
jgi:multidrug efflux pump subunit AcrA (membrane-fusion protein)